MVGMTLKEILEAGLRPLPRDVGELVDYWGYSS